MSASILRIVIAVVLIAHGIGHTLAVLPVFGYRLSPTHSLNSWLFTNLLGNTAANVIGIVIWLLASIGFVGAGLGLLGWLVPHDWWQSLATGAAVISLVGIALYWSALPYTFPNKVGAIVVDVVVLVSLLWLHWPSEIVSR